ncbi:MAG TPA: hypothetical protein VLB09_00890, partial [Nitrospiria bacterium]|nr:hypothetical protein [Nitrospiria bacterium]
EPSRKTDFFGLYTESSTPMARISLESIPEEQAEKIYLSGKLSEAQKVEALLTREGVHYAVSIEPYRGGGLLSSFFEYKGAMFYVRSDQAAHCRKRLEDQGFGHGVMYEGVAGGNDESRK